MRKTIDEYWWAPVLVRKNPRAQAQIMTSYLRTTRKRMIQDFIDASYCGKHDWKYRQRLGWKAVRLRVTGSCQ